jgi:anti-anti-sigma factor
MVVITVNDEINVTINIKLLNIHNAQGIAAKLEEASQEHKTKNFIINLENVESIDSSSIAMFVEFVQTLKDSGRELTFTNLSPFVKRIFDMLHIAKFFKIK